MNATKITHYGCVWLYVSYHRIVYIGHNTKVYSGGAVLAETLQNKFHDTIVSALIRDATSRDTVQSSEATPIYFLSNNV
jgi:hypothetical protein